MKLRCRQEARNEIGEKIMEFTKGQVYYFTEIGTHIWTVESDNGTTEKFFNLNVMFEKV